MIHLNQEEKSQKNLSQQQQQKVQNYPNDGRSISKLSSSTSSSSSSSSPSSSSSSLIGSSQSDSGKGFSSSSANFINTNDNNNNNIIIINKKPSINTNENHDKIMIINNNNPTTTTTTSIRARPTASTGEEGVAIDSSSPPLPTISSSSASFSSSSSPFSSDGGVYDDDDDDDYFNNNKKWTIMNKKKPHHHQQQPREEEEGKAEDNKEKDVHVDCADDDDEENEKDNRFVLKQIKPQKLSQKNEQQEEEQATLSRSIAPSSSSSSSSSTSSSSTSLPITISQSSTPLLSSSSTSSTLPFQTQTDFMLMIDNPKYQHQLQQQEEEKKEVVKQNRKLLLFQKNQPINQEEFEMNIDNIIKEKNSIEIGNMNGNFVKPLNFGKNGIKSDPNNNKNKNNGNDDDEVDGLNNNTGDNSADDGKNQPMERGQWSGKLDFIFSCISYAVGLGNVWRFPYLCYENGGGAFLVPYLICIFIIGVPLFLMEVSLGQYFHAGGVSIWNQIPIFKGVGFASMIMIGLCNTYYIVIISWTLYYLFSSIKIPLPWMSCNNEWNTNLCWFDVDSNEQTPNGSVSPAQEFWQRKVLDISDDMADVGQIQWHLFITLIIAWILVYFVIWKGIHQSGKIIWVMAMFPYVILTILFGYGISLPGALDGIKFYITPRWHMLREAKIWVAAGTQLLFTYGIGIGTNIALGSYNPTNHNFYRDSFIACLLSSFTSLFSGFVIFSVLGHMAKTMNVDDIGQVARSGPGLAFIVYPEAVTRLPLPNLWAILFFLMLLVLGIDSQFCTVESFVTGIVDEWPTLLRPYRKFFTLFVIVIHFILGISMITSGGMYVFQLMDNFSASGISLIIVVLFELVAFGWIYGGKRIYNNMIEMLDFKPSKLLYYLWCFISPLCLLAILIFSIVDYQPPEYAGRPFPWYGEIFGLCIALSSIIFIPSYMIYFLLFKSDKRLSFKQRLLSGFRPIDEQKSTKNVNPVVKQQQKIEINNNFMA